MTRNTHKLLAVLLSVIMVFSILPVIPFTAFAKTVSGTCGDNITWKYDTSSKTLTISGTGAMNDYKSSYYNADYVTTAPWKSYYNTMKTVVINSGVTSIGDYAFCYCTGLTSITIPDSVTSIGNYAFYGCTGLKTAGPIGGGYDYEFGWTDKIPDNAFYYCNGLTSITIPDSVTSIGDCAFYGCAGLTSINIPDGVTSIGDCAFAHCSYLTSITIPNGVTSIGSSAFSGCVGLSSITIPDGVTSIDSSAFYNCTRLTSITIPDSVTSIGDYAFYGCTGLTSITIPDSVTSIGSSAFYGCTGLTSITIPDSVTSIGTGAFTNTAWYDNQPDGLVYAGKMAYTYKGECPESVIIKDGTLGIADYAFYYCTGLTSITIPDSVTSIGDRAFFGCTGLTSITIPNSVTKIGDYAFYGCTGLTSVTIGNSVTSIGRSAFSGCTGLTEITIPDSVTSIGGWAFSDTAWYNNQPDGLVYAGKVAYKYKGACPESVIIKDGTLGIAGCAFLRCTGLTSITIPDSVTEIGSSAFYYCTGLTSITIPDSVTSIGIEMFYYCTGLTSITIPDSVTSIGGSAFEECTGLTSITIPVSVTSIGGGAFGGGAFQGCTGLTSVTIGNGVTSIGSYAFYNCTGLKDVYYAGSIQQKSNISIGSSNDSLKNATWHYATLLNAKSATCTETGYTGDTGWEENGEVIEYGETIPALGHSYTAVVTAPTCTAQGHTTHTCSRCSDSYKDNYTYMSCGENCGFIIEDNTLYIHGTGNTDNYKTQASVPWYDFANSINRIVIDEGITGIGHYAFNCFNNLDSVIIENENISFGKYVFNSNSDLTVFAQSGGNIEEYCNDSKIDYVDISTPAPTPELETVTANSITVKAIAGYEYSLDGTVWQNSNTFTGLSPAREYNIYARYAATADIFDTAGAPLVVTTLKLAVSAPAAPGYQSHTDNSITLVPNELYEYSIDGENWQKSSEFTELSKNTVYRFYQRVAETETEYVSTPSAAIIIAIPGKPEITDTTEETITVKAISGFEYCLDDFIWQNSNTFNMLIDHTEYEVYQRLKSVEDEKVYRIISDAAHALTIEKGTHTPGDINGDGAINNKDLTRLFRYLSDWDVAVNEAALDINGDGTVNNKDLTRLFQYLSDWDVEIF